MVAPPQKKQILNTRTEPAFGVTPRLVNSHLKNVVAKGNITVKNAPLRAPRQERNPLWGDAACRLLPERETFT